RLAGPVSGNVLLRRAQHERLADAGATLALAARFVQGKVRAQRLVLARAARTDDAGPGLAEAAEKVRRLGHQAAIATSLDELRGIEGQAAALYFDHFDRLVTAPDLRFTTRTRRPPLDPVNALLSFLY